MENTERIIAGPIDNLGSPPHRTSFTVTGSAKRFARIVGGGGYWVGQHSESVDGPWEDIELNTRTLALVVKS